MSIRASHLFGAPIVPDRIRTIGPGGFCFFPNRFLQDGFFAALAADELLLYVFWVLVGDRRGVSFWGHQAICALLRIPLERYLIARNALIEKDLVAFDGYRIQVLALPTRPPKPPSPLTQTEDFETRDPATIRQLLAGAFHGERQGAE